MLEQDGLLTAEAPRRSNPLLMSMKRSMSFRSRKSKRAAGKEGARVDEDPTEALSDSSRTLERRGSMVEGEKRYASPLRKPVSRRASVGPTAPGRQRSLRGMLRRDGSLRKTMDTYKREDSVRALDGHRSPVRQEQPQRRRQSLKRDGSKQQGSFRRLFRRDSSRRGALRSEDSQNPRESSADPTQRRGPLTREPSKKEGSMRRLLRRGASKRDSVEQSENADREPVSRRSSFHREESQGRRGALRRQASQRKREALQRQTSSRGIARQDSQRGASLQTGDSRGDVPKREKSRGSLSKLFKGDRGHRKSASADSNAAQWYLDSQTSQPIPLKLSRRGSLKPAHPEAQSNGSKSQKRRSRRSSLQTDNLPTALLEMSVRTDPRRRSESYKQQLPSTLLTETEPAADRKRRKSFQLKRRGGTQESVIDELANSNSSSESHPLSRSQHSTSADTKSAAPAKREPRQPVVHRNKVSATLQPAELWLIENLDSSMFPMRAAPGQRSSSLPGTAAKAAVPPPEPEVSRTVLVSSSRKPKRSLSLQPKKVSKPLVEIYPEKDGRKVKRTHSMVPGSENLSPRPQTAGRRLPLCFSRQLSTIPDASVASSATTTSEDEFSVGTITTATRQQVLAENTSNYVRINHGRMLHGVQPLERSSFLDTLARLHARKMARLKCVMHSYEDISHLQKRLDAGKVGENILRGLNLKEMHNKAMQEGSSSFRNISDPSFSEFGMSTAIGIDGVYMCQLFR